VTAQRYSVGEYRLRRLLAGLLVAVGLWGGLAAAHDQTDAPVEQRVKAAMLYNFTRFITWPVAAGPDLQLCVVGRTSLEPALRDIEGKQSQGMSLRLKSGVAEADLVACHMVLIGRSEAGRVDDLLRRLARRPVLTVSDLEGFATRGGVIELLLVDNKVRFDINTAAAQRAGLSISSKLLRLANNIRESLP
jgi:hypothetical protein